MSQVLKLVELAIHQAHCISLVSGEPTGCAVEADSNEQPPEWISSESEPVKLVTKTAKKKARKKRSKAAAAAIAPEEEPHNQAGAVSLQTEATKSFLRPVEARSDSGDDSGVAAKSRSNSSDGNGASAEAAGRKSSKSSTSSAQRQRSRSSSACSRAKSPKKPQGDSHLNFDWSPEGPPIDATSDNASVELEVDWSVGFNRHLMQTRWSAWLSNGMTGNAAEWSWESGGVPTLAFTKNTFLETMDKYPDDRHVRPRSLPPSFRPSELWTVAEAA